jgi:hypothetical protein
MKLLKSLTGVRTAVMALVLLAEVVARGLGHDVGPIFSIIRSAFAAIGWDYSPGNLLFDPATTGTAVLTLYAVAIRAKAWWAERARPSRPPIQ